MLRYADRTTILLCVCPSGQKKVRKPFSGVDVISLWVGGELALVCNSSGWRMVGEETHGGWGDPMVGAAPGDARSTPAAAPTLVWTSHHPYTHPNIPLPACACLHVCFLLVYLFNCFSVGLVFYLSQLPKLSGCVQLNFSFGYIEFRSWAFWDLFLQKGFQHKIKFLKFMFFTLFSKTKWTVELLPWHEIFSCGAGHNVWTGRFDVVLHLMPHFFDVVFLQMPHFHFLRTSFLFLSCSHFLFEAMSVLWSAPRFISSFVA